MHFHSAVARNFTFCSSYLNCTHIAHPSHVLTLTRKLPFSQADFTDGAGASVGSFALTRSRANRDPLENVVDHIHSNTDSSDIPEFARGGAEPACNQQQAPIHLYQRYCQLHHLAIDGPADDGKAGPPFRDLSQTSPITGEFLVMADHKCRDGYNRR